MNSANNGEFGPQSESRCREPGSELTGRTEVFCQEGLLHKKRTPLGSFLRGSHFPLSPLYSVSTSIRIARATSRSTAISVWSHSKTMPGNV
jgi:hypothetical protein